MIIPGILESTFEKTKSEAEAVGNIAEKIQIDIADGILVDGTTFLDLGKLIDLDLSASIQLHLMVRKPEELLSSIPANVKDVCCQAEAFLYRIDYTSSFIEILKSKGCSVGLAFNPDTPTDDFGAVFPLLDYIQFMTVIPGGQGRSFVESSLEKITKFKEKHPNLPLQTDGGIDLETLPKVINAGAVAEVVGSKIFSSGDAKVNYKTLVEVEEKLRGRI